MALSGKAEIKKYAPLFKNVKIDDFRSTVTHGKHHRMSKIFSSSESSFNFLNQWCVYFCITPKNNPENRHWSDPPLRASLKSVKKRNKPVRVSSASAQRDVRIATLFMLPVNFNTMYYFWRLRRKPEHSERFPYSRILAHKSVLNTVKPERLAALQEAVNLSHITRMLLIIRWFK